MLDRILARFGYFPREFARINNGADAVARGERWEMFYREEGGLADMLTGIRQSYFAKYAKLKADDLAGRERLALLDHLAQELDGKVRSVIDTGKIQTKSRP